MMFYDWLYLYYSRFSVKINHFQSFSIAKNHVIILCRMYKIKKASPKGEAFLSCMSNKLPRPALGDCFNLRRRPGRHDAAALFPAAGAHINDIICISDHIQIMFNDEHSRPVIDQRLKYAK